MAFTLKINMSDALSHEQKYLKIRTGTGPHFSAFAPEPPGSLLFPLLSHATTSPVSTTSMIKQGIIDTHIVQVVERTKFIPSAVP